MAAGTYGGYVDDEIRVCKAGLPKEISYLKGETDRIGKVSRECDRVQGRDNTIKHREREVLNVEFQSTSSWSDSGNRVVVPRRRFEVRIKDREPGELSSDESDGASDLETREIEVTVSEIGVRLSPVENKKRKFLPDIWDEVRPIKSRNNFLSSNLPAPPSSNNAIPDFNVPTLLSDDSEVCNSEGSPIVKFGALSKFPAETSSCEREEPEANDIVTGEIEDVDHVPERTRVSSRWANDAESLIDAGEISNSRGFQKVRRNSGSVSPELGEVRGNGSERFRERSSSRSDEHISSPGRDGFHDKDGNSDYMEIDDDHNYNANGGQSDTESDDDQGSSGTPESAQPPIRSVNMLQGCRNVDEFERLNKIDEGTYGVVFRARDKKTGEIVALKKVKMEKEREGFPLTSLREINILLSFHHPSIVDVKEVVVGRNLDSIFMVMEYMEHDLKALMETMKHPFSQSEVKCLMLQLLEGINYLHSNWVLHRDLKTSNLLLNNCGELKICDFGLARQYGSPLKPYTSLVVTLWYRAPELLLGGKQYSTAIDMWSLGCIMAELLSKEPLFNGNTEVDQLDKIFKILGTPNETIWPGFSKFPGSKANFIKNKYNLLRKKFPATYFTGSPVLSDAGFDLLNKLLTYDPEKRITAEEALNHEWFREVPLPKSKEFMPTFPAQHAQDRRMRRIMKSPDPLEALRRKELQQRELGGGGLFGL